MTFLYKIFGWLLYFVYSFVQNYGWSIVIFTIICKLILLPLNIKSTKSTREVQMLQPEMNRLQKKYQNNPEKLNLEMQKLYKIYGVNPMGGCLPLLLQLPIIYGLFGALRSPLDYVFQNLPAAEANAIISEQWFWIPNLANPDPYYILPILCVLFTYISQKFTMSVSQTPENQQSSQKMMLYIMPLMIGFFAMSMPAGISLYWVIQNVFTFFQQFFMLRKPVETLDPAEVEKKLREYDKAQKAERTEKRESASQARQDAMNRQMGVESKPTEKKKSSVKMTPASGKKVKRKTITKIPERKE